MLNPYCKKCSVDEYNKDGNCSRLKAKDGFVARCGQPWALEKHKILKLYNHLLSEGMKNNFKNINYIDLFAGPGIYFNRKSGVEKFGSPLIAINYNYSKIFLTDINEENCEALRFRTSNLKDKVFIFNEDANLVTQEIRRNISSNSINFCFVDPNNMGEFKFKTIVQISKYRRIDFLINFPYLGYRRSYKQLMAEDSENKKIDEFFGTDEWRNIENQLSEKKAVFRANALIDLYIRQLQKIGYKKATDKERHQYIFPVYNSKKGLLYYLIFVSKHKRGYDFFRKMRRYAVNQQELDLI